MLLTPECQSFQGLPCPSSAFVVTPAPGGGPTACPVPSTSHLCCSPAGCVSRPPRRPTPSEPGEVGHTQWILQMETCQAGAFLLNQPGNGLRDRLWGAGTRGPCLAPGVDDCHLESPGFGVKVWAATQGLRPTWHEGPPGHTDCGLRIGLGWSSRGEGPGRMTWQRVATFSSVSGTTLAEARGDGCPFVLPHRPALSAPGN